MKIQSTFLLIVALYPFNSLSSANILLNNALSTISSFVPRLEKQRLPCTPYISADTFRSICDHMCDEVLDSMLIPTNVNKGDIIFVNPAFKDYFFDKIHPLIKNTYILVTVGHDMPTPGKFLNMLADQKIFHWFGANGDIIEHPKFTHIPIGISNYYWPNGKTDILKEISLANLEKKHLISINLSISTNRAEPVYKYFTAKSFCTVLPKKDFKNYLEDLKKSWSVVSPHGNGLDCHRTWEALLVGTYPVVKKSTIDILYKDLPVIVINDWQEVTESFLKNKIKEFAIAEIGDKFKHEKLFFPYYSQLISSKKSDCLLG